MIFSISCIITTRSFLDQFHIIEWKESNSGFEESYFKITIDIKFTKKWTSELGKMNL